MNKNILTVLISIALSGITAFAIVKSNNSDKLTQDVSYAPDGQMVRTVNLSVSDYPDFTFAAETAVEAVVYVKVVAKSKAPQQQYSDPFFQFFFGDGYGDQGRERIKRGSGSGVIIREDGYIVTNNHVVTGATEIEVTLNNNKSYPATIIGTDPATDIALIKVDAKGLPTVKFADSDKLRRRMGTRHRQPSRRGAPLDHHSRNRQCKGPFNA